MEQISFQLMGGLKPEQIETLFEKACILLEKTGLLVTNKDIWNFLVTKHEFKHDSTCIQMKKEAVLEMVQELRLRKSAKVRNNRKNYELRILSGYPIYVEDVAHSKTRLATTEDAIRLTKLVDSLQSYGVKGSTPVVPQDVAPHLRHLKCYLIGSQYCSSGPEVSIGSIQTAEDLFPMMEVMGQTPDLGVFVINPLKAEGDTFDTLHKYYNKFNRFTVGCMPMMGLSAPISLAGTLVIALASVLGAMMIVRAYRPDAEFNVEARCWPVDMKTLDISYGMPEMILGDLCYNLFCDFFGWEQNGCKAFHSTALRADPQANAQRAAYAMAMALHGQRKFQYGGLLGTDMIFSEQQLIYDIEILRYIKYATDGFELSEETIDLDTIFEMGADGNYLVADSTLDNYRKISFVSNLWTSKAVAGEFEHETLQGISQHANDFAKKMIEQHTYCLDELRMKELKKLYEMKNK